jgi:hypothetical protein
MNERAASSASTARVLWWEAQILREGELMIGRRFIFVA